MLPSLTRRLTIAREILEAPVTVDTIAACLTILHCPAAAAALIETSRDILINTAPPVTPPSQAGDTGVQTGGSSSHRISPALTWLLLLRSPMGIFRYYCHSSPFLHTPHPVHASSIPPQPENVGGREETVDKAFVRVSESTVRVVATFAA